MARVDEGMSWTVYPAPTRRIRFSRTELRHILMALTVLTLAFGLAFAGGFRAHPLIILSRLLLAAIAVPTGFLLHELGHKVIAQRYGHWAEFRSYPYGLLLAVMTSLFGFLFAAPGAVMISGYVNNRQNGRISAAGPLVNLVIGGGAATLWFLMLVVGLNLPIFVDLTVRGLAHGVASINLLLGTFNMLPFPPLDGSKVLRWDLWVYILLLGANVGLFVVLLVAGLI